MIEKGFTPSKISVVAGRSVPQVPPFIIEQESRTQSEVKLESKMSRKVIISPDELYFTIAGVSNVDVAIKEFEQLRPGLDI